MALTERKYAVTLLVDMDTQNPVEERWQDDQGRFDRREGPAHLVFDPVSGNKLKEAFYQIGKLHRDENLGPAIREWDQQGHLLMEAYYEYGRLSRSDREPALTRYDAGSGEVIEQRFYTFDLGEINPKTGRRIKSERTDYPDMGF
jgi:hypothetical protein